ncbi:hypothetical protein Pme01_52050 [Planosporangium mesophilum]|uniref:Uncharacterized protein n=1 Tax=Planosporangium mesophilum TaxID=689768 RepID=A0A8J3X6E2_9ACTN|nr:hypothetical protein Pme01_52050 [Planosporangium mesophilum]
MRLRLARKTSRIATPTKYATRQRTGTRWTDHDAFLARAETGPSLARTEADTDPARTEGTRRLWRAPAGSGHLHPGGCPFSRRVRPAGPAQSAKPA